MAVRNNDDGWEFEQRACGGLGANNPWHHDLQHCQRYFTFNNCHP